uniref:Uncharacterized protein n=1 Tax=Rhizophagus irregularis (strain DAOM 181602 / DAOM 197198 / MUCL 43194) TaxID=747089 RepID=U9UPW8_RHIID
MLMSKISSMITLDYYSGYDVDNYIVCSPETKVCLINLTELWCRSNIYGLTQNNLKSVTFESSFYENDDKVKFIISSLTKFNP